jgi:hypothetical protein
MPLRNVSRVASALLAWAVISSIAAPAAAQTALNVQRASANTFRVDGALRDWAAVAMQPFGAGDDASFEVALAHDDAGVYVAARVRDERMIRTRRPGDSEDVLVLTLVTPGNEGPEAVEFWLYAGVEGESAAVALVAEPGGRTRAARGARILEAPIAGGYELEAFLPVALIPNAGRLSAMRAAVRLVDVDVATAPEIEATIASAPVSASELTSVPEAHMASGPANAVAAFRRDNGLAAAPIGFEFWGDLAGDEREERVLVIGGVLVVVGEGYRDGRGYDFERLGVRSADDVQRARIEDVTGDGKAEIILRIRERDRHGVRASWMVLGTNGDGLTELLSVPVFERTRQGIVRSRVELRRQRRGAPFIDVHVGDAEGIDPATYAGPATGDTLSILVPWGPVLRQTYQWNGESFAETESQPNPNARVEGAEVATTETERPATTQPVRDTPRAAAMSDDDVLARVRADRGVPATVAVRFRARANVAEGREPEQVFALGGAIVVHGPGFQGGQGYFFFEAAPAEADLLSVETADLTGDGQLEIVFTFKQHLGEFQRDILTVLQFTASGIQPLLRVEVARYHGDAERIVNAVDLRRRGRVHTLSIAPGEARGWDATTWPFAGFANDGVAPLLLPWQDEARRYRYADGAIVTP